MQKYTVFKDLDFFLNWYVLYFKIQNVFNKTPVPEAF